MSELEKAMLAEMEIVRTQHHEGGCMVCNASSAVGFMLGHFRARLCSRCASVLGRQLLLRC